MRKIYVSALALMIGAIGFAQTNKSDVTQLGVDGVSKVVQIGGGLNNAIQYQRTPGGSGAGLVDIYQNGQGNYANQQQEAHWPVGTPASDYTIFTENRGKEASAVVKQVGNGNKAWQTQRWDNESAYAEQRGHRNESRQKQWGAENIANVKQYDNDHKATQNQYGRRVEAYITQRGWKNTATQTQNKPGFDDYATATQTGRENVSDQTQAGKGQGRGPLNANLVSVYQSGDRNFARQNQSNDGSSNARNEAKIIQRGNGGQAYQEQHGNSGIQLLEQKNGVDNYGYQNQYAGSVDGDASLMQNGSYNDSWQHQYGTNNSSNVVQNGNSNWSKVTQKGSGNTNTVTQTHP